MDLDGLSREEVRLHHRLTDALRQALDGSDPLAAAQALLEDWAEPHRERRERAQQLKTAILKAEAHFKFAEVDRLQAELDAIVL